MKEMTFTKKGILERVSYWGREVLNKMTFNKKRF